jgi:hypothetical protein
MVPWIRIMTGYGTSRPAGQNTSLGLGAGTPTMSAAPHTWQSSLTDSSNLGRASFHRASKGEAVACKTMVVGDDGS